MSCSTTSTTTKCQGDLFCDLGCPIELDSCCVYFTGLNQIQIGILTGDNLNDIITKLSALDYNPSVFIANTTNSIIAQPGGFLGHSPTYSLRINPSTGNILKLNPLGVFVDRNAPGDGKVSIDGSDIKDYLESKFGVSTDEDDILTVIPFKVNGKIQITPTINMANLLTVIGNSFSSLWCSIFGGCGPSKVRPTSTTSTTTQAPGPTSSTSSSTTSTTTHSPTSSTSSTTSTTTQGGPTTTTTSTSSSTTSTTTHAFDTTLGFAGSNQANAFGVIATIASTDSVTKFKFDHISPTTGSPANMDIYIGGSLYMVVSFPTDYLGTSFQYIHFNGTVHTGAFTNGTVNI